MTTPRSSTIAYSVDGDLAGKRVDLDLADVAAVGEVLLLRGPGSAGVEADPVGVGDAARVEERLGDLGQGHGAVLDSDDFVPAVDELEVVG